jgi:hypothetical protein
MRRAAFALLGLMFAALAAPRDVRAVADDPGDLHGIRLGLQAADLPLDGFVDFACGSDGGPPKKVIADWTEFAQCLAEPSGLHEVYARFDDEREYQARAAEIAEEVERSGTRIAGHPVIFSVLFSDAGTAEALRIVTDPRAPVDLRRRAYLLRIRILGQYGPEGWACTDIPLAERESAVGGIAIKQQCEKTLGERRHTLFTQFYRRPGQTGFMEDGRTPRPGDFVSSTRWEISRVP